MGVRKSNRSDTRQLRRRNLKRLLHPRHVAFVGGRQLEEFIALCLRAGFQGEVWPVNPKYRELGGIRCFASVEDLPEPPDAAFLTLNPERTIEIVLALKAIRASGAICFAAGFAELGSEGKVLQDALVEAAGDMAVVGPNCMGFQNLFDNAVLWGGRTRLGHPGEHGVAIVSQSGAWIHGIGNVERAFPMGYGISIGNQAVVDASDYIDVLLDDERVRAIGLYLEGIADGPALAESCARSLKKGVPIVSLKGGSTDMSAQPALSHTGNLTVPGDYWQAFTERYGLIEVKSPKALVESLKLLHVAGPPRGRRLVVTTLSGAAATLIVEKASALGLELPAPSTQNRARLSDVLPKEVTITNPLDLAIPYQSRTGVSIEDSGSITQCLLDLAGGQADLIAFFLDIPRSGQGLEERWLVIIEAMIRLRQLSSLPCVVASILPEGLEESIRIRLTEGGVAPLLGLEDALTAIAVCAHYGAARGDAETSVGGFPHLPLLRSNHEPTNVRPLDEWDSKSRLAKFGLPVPEGWVGPAEATPEAAAVVGFPVAVKILSAQLPHKSRVGGVKLNLQDKAEVKKAVAEIGHAISTHVPELVDLQFLVEPMVQDGVGEILLGVKRHPELGLALVIGHGGAKVEKLRNYTTLLLPLAEGSLDKSFAKLCIIRDLELDKPGIEALKGAARAVAGFAETHFDILTELDVNPLIVRRDGSVMAVDACIVTEGTTWDHDTTETSPPSLSPMEGFRDPVKLEEPTTDDWTCG